MGIRVFICSTLFSLAAVTSLFAQNQPPAAQPQSVFTNGLETLEITLRGSDPEGKDLRFEILEPPRSGEISEPKPVVPPEETDPRTGEPFQPPITSAVVRYTPFEVRPDSFTFAVIDAEGATGTATVLINPGDEEPPPPPETVVAVDALSEVYVDRETTLTLLGQAPKDLSLRFEIVSEPRSGKLGELIQGSEEPQRTATVLYIPERGFLGEDRFEFEVCGEGECDRGLIRINVVEPQPGEDDALVSDVNVKTFIDEPVTFSLVTTTRPRLQGETYVLRALIAGNVADSNGDGRGDNVNPLPGSEPLLMRAGVQLDDGEGATGTARMQIEWDIRELAERAESMKIERADVRLHTHRAGKEGVNTFFHWIGEDGDGELGERDFEREAEAIPGAIMTMPSLEQLPVGGEGTFSFSVEGELDEALRGGFRVFSVQGRVKEEKERERAAGLDVRTSAEDNLREGLEPELVVVTSRPAPPLEYIVRTLAEGGALFDYLGNEIREVPYRLPDPRVTFRPAPKFFGEVRFTFEGTDGIRAELASVIIKVILGRCQDDVRFCNNGR